MQAARSVSTPVEYLPLDTASYPRTLTWLLGMRIGIGRHRAPEVAMALTGNNTVCVCVCVCVTAWCDAATDRTSVQHKHNNYISMYEEQYQHSNATNSSTADSIKMHHAVLSDVYRPFQRNLLPSPSFGAHLPNNTVPHVVRQFCSTQR